MNTEKGLVIIYTGEGKGKTTAALGLILRAVGYKKKCLMIQFGKHWFTGELAGIKKLAPLVKIIQGGKGFMNIDRFALKSNLPQEEHTKAAFETFELLYKEVMSDKWDIIVADEIIGATSSGLLPLSSVIKLITDKPQRLDLILTGHHLPSELVPLADLVTEMVEIKHPFQQGILAKKGVDF